MFKNIYNYMRLNVCTGFKDRHSYLNLYPCVIKIQSVDLHIHKRKRLLEMNSRGEKRKKKRARQKVIKKTRKKETCQTFIYVLKQI